jgi:hypothetical protein
MDNVGGDADDGRARLAVELVRHGHRQPRHHSPGTSASPGCRASGAPQPRLLPLGPASLRSGDPFGFFESRRDVPPRVSPSCPASTTSPPWACPPAAPSVRSAAARRSSKTRGRLIGIDYRAGDPLKRIGGRRPRAAARWRSRVYEPSSSLHLLIALASTPWSSSGKGTTRSSWALHLAGRLGRALGLRTPLRHQPDRQQQLSRLRPAMAIRRPRPGAAHPHPQALAMISPLTIASLEDVLDDAVRRCCRSGRRSL